ncbi:hypothetical protein MKW98_003241 [Papaver atlanticum]|uniref:Serine aminopeptidase S33 domain-containing protein n=1 Tax=Papaver atlanticum TaxID=357466 RepID=A0AAD4SP13_9MAGN|nr:hypothetical protein MKW98_003241 [Papaver atlanticum]
MFSHDLHPTTNFSSSTSSSLLLYCTNENSPFGNLIGDEFYKKYQILHKQSFIGVVAMIHGYKTESTWIFELTALAIAKLGFMVWFPGHIPSIQPVIDDCTKFFDSNSLVLNGALCGISNKFKPIWPLEHFIPLAGFVAPSWRIVINLIYNNPDRQIHGKPPAATALEFTRICELPLLIVHGEDDLVSDSNNAMLLYESSKKSKENVGLVFETIFSWLQDRADKLVANTIKTTSTA